MKLKLFAAVTLGAGLLSAAEAPERLTAAAESLKEVMDTPDKSIPQDLLSKAQCIVIVPGLKKGAFIIGAKYGKGFVSCRRPGGVGWSAPGSIRVEGGSFGFQIGGAETDVFMLVMNDKGMDRLLSTKFTLGADASVAAGPVGRSTQAETDAALTAEILTWSRQRGLFAGISLSGATLREDSDWNRDLYGKKVTNRDLVMKGTVKTTKKAGALVTELNRSSSCNQRGCFGVFRAQARRLERSRPRRRRLLRRVRRPPAERRGFSRHRHRSRQHPGIRVATRTGAPAQPVESSGDRLRPGPPDAADEPPLCRNSWRGCFR